MYTTIQNSEYYLDPPKHYVRHTSHYHVPTAPLRSGFLGSGHLSRLPSIKYPAVRLHRNAAQRPATDCARGHLSAVRRGPPVLCANSCPTFFRRCKAPGAQTSAQHALLWIRLLLSFLSLRPTIKSASSPATALSLIAMLTLTGFVPRIVCHATG